MTFNQLKMAIFATYITNKYGFKLSGITDAKIRKQARIDYSDEMLKSLNIKIKVINLEKMPNDGKYLLTSNHRTVIDPVIVEQVTRYTNLHGDWIAKKELYNSFFFGKFVKNSGTILLDRENAQMGDFFKDIKESVKSGNSIYIFPEGTRNKTDEAISEFKEGARIIAIKNRLPILPIFIRSRADKILKDAIADSSIERTIEVEVGDIIDYKDKTNSLEQNYKNQFNL